MDEQERPRYRDIELRFDIHGPDGNVFVIIGKIAAAIEAVYGRRPAELFEEEALAAHSYEEVLSVCRRHVYLVTE